MTSNNNPNHHHYWTQNYGYTTGTNGNLHLAPPYPYGNQNPQQPTYSHPFVASQVTSQYIPPPHQYANAIYHQQHQMQYAPPPPPPPPQPLVTHVNSNSNQPNTPNNPNNNEQYHCDACSIAFPTLSALNSHNASHIKCTKCEFVGSKKVVSAHFQSAHGKFAGRGLKTITIQVPGSKHSQRFKICVGNHPDDIREWIEERKKKFPTKANIALKEERKRKRSSLDEHITHESSYDKRISLNPEPSNALQKKVESVQHENTALSTLMAGYDSSSDEEISKATSTVQTNIETTRMQNGSSMGQDTISSDKTKQCRFFLRNGTCKNGDTCTYIHDPSKHEEYKTNSGVRKQSQSERDKARNALKKEMDILTTGRTQSGKKAEASLLRKLLQNDIRRERTLCLQLLRYIADCNYLQGKRGGTDSAINTTT